MGRVSMQQKEVRLSQVSLDILTKELSKICKFFVMLCLRILFARDKSSLVLSLDTILTLRTVLFRNVLHK